MAIVKDLTVLGPSRFLGDGEFDTIEAMSFKKRGSSASYVLLGDGTHKPLSEISSSTHDHDAVYAKKDGSNIAANTSWANLSVGGSAGSLSAIIADDKLPDRLRQYITNAVTAEANGFGRMTSGAPFAFLHSSSADCMLISTAYSTSWAAQLALDYRSNNLAVRNKNSGTWNEWAYFLPVMMSTSSLSDCNSVNSTGIWTKSNFSNKPTGVNDWGSLFNIRLYTTNNNYHRQLFFDCYGTDKIWTRSDNNGTWTTWKELLNSSNYHSKYNTTGSTSYIKIKINSTNTWMISFLVRVYQGYNSYDIVFSGYQYGSHHWYRPQAILQSSTNTSIKVYFGYESNNNLFVVISGASYTGVEILNATNGYTEITDKLTIGDLFTITNSSSLPSTIQTTDESETLQSVCDSTGAVTIYRPWYRNETVNNATNATNAVYADKAYTIYSCTTSTSDTRGHWTATVSGITSYYDGLTIHVKLGTAYYGNSEGYNTLNVNGLGPKVVWYGYNSRLTSHYGANAELIMTYRTTAGSYAIPSPTTGEMTAGTTVTDGWVIHTQYDTNDTTTMRLAYSQLKAGAGGIKTHSMIMEDSNGTWQSFTTGTGGIGTSKTKNTAAFKLGSKIYYVYRGSDLAANENLGNDSIRAFVSNMDFRYSLNCGANTLQPKIPIYIKGSLGTDGYFYLDDTWWTQTIPTSEDGKLYIRVSEAMFPESNGNCYRGDLLSDGNVYWYKDNAFRIYEFDTKVTSSANHYAPATVSGQDKTASASGGSASWNTSVVSSVTLNTDGKGHVTGISVGSIKTPAQPSSPGSGTMQISANGGTAVNTLFNANSSTATNAINFKAGDNTSIEVTAASGTTPASVKISSTGGTSGNYVQYTSETNHVEKITVATSPGNNANTLYIIL